MIAAESPDVQQVRAGGCTGASNPKWRHELWLCRDLCWCGAALYKNVLNAIVEDGEATVLGLRRSKPLFFSLGGSFSYSKQLHKRLPVSLATSPSDLGPFISLPSLSMTCPHQGSYKISPFPMKHQQTFWRVWLSPRWISEVSVPPLFFPPSFPPLPPLLCQYHPSLGWTSDPQRLPWRAVVTETQSKTKEELLRRGKRAVSHFLGGASVVDGKRMHCGLLEEADMDSTGQSFFFFFFYLLALWGKWAWAVRAAANLWDFSKLSLRPERTSDFKWFCVWSYLRTGVFRDNLDCWGTAEKQVSLWNHEKSQIQFLTLF